MMHIVRAELGRFTRARTLALAIGGAVLFAIVTTVAVIAPAAERGVSDSRRGGTTIAELSTAGGASIPFAIGASFAGFLIFVMFIAVVASEFSGGTFRALLLRDPHRLRLIAGKLLALLLVIAATAAVAEITSIGIAAVIAPSQHVSTGGWWSLAGVGDALHDYGTVMAGVTGWAIFGSTLAVAFRSAPVALGVGFAWAGPFENIVVDSWSAGYRWFPGQVLGSMIRGGTIELGFARALVTAAAYATVAGTAMLLLVERRDVTV